MMFRLNVNRALAIVTVFFTTACGSGALDAGFPPIVTPSGGGGGGAAAAYTGAIADSLHHGLVALTVSGGSTVTGLLTFVGGPTVPVTGSADSAASSITATGSGYTLTGTTHTGTVRGTYTGPSGSIGYFAAASDTLTLMTHTTYCGTYASTNGTGNGWFSVVALSDGESAGFSVQTAGSAASHTFLGTIDFTLLTFAATTDQAVQATGTVSPDLQTIIGSYAPNMGTTTGTGNFSATTGGC
jgi:hypothetical protein